jgi:hypothetical protein
MAIFLFDIYHVPHVYVLTELQAFADPDLLKITEDAQEMRV